jgi:hypothetical protein
VFSAPHPRVLLIAGKPVSRDAGGMDEQYIQLQLAKAAWLREQARMSSGSVSQLLVLAQDYENQALGIQPAFVPTAEFARLNA